MTLFAPTNAAFDALPPPTFTALVSDKIALQVFDGDGHDHGYNDDDGHYDDGGEHDRSHIPQWMGAYPHIGTVFKSEL